MNSRNLHYFAGYRDDWKVDHVIRPLIIDAIDYGTPEVVQFLIKFNVDLDAQYDECFPCGPACVLGFRDTVESDLTYVVRCKLLCLHILLSV